GAARGGGGCDECWGAASGPWSVRTSSLWAFIELRMARSSRKSGRPSAISKANRSRGRRTGLKTRRSDTFSVFERERWLASTSRILPRQRNCSTHGAVGGAGRNKPVEDPKKLGHSESAALNHHGRGR